MSAGRSGATLIEAGCPSLWVYWFIDDENGPIVLDFLADD